MIVSMLLATTLVPGRLHEPAESAPARTSTITPRRSPCGRRAAGWPPEARRKTPGDRWSAAPRRRGWQPRGRVTPLLTATLILPSAIVQVEMSTMIGGPPRNRNARGDRVGREPALGSPVGGHEDPAAARVHEVERDLALAAGHLGPVADPAQVARVPQRHHRHAELRALVHGERTASSPITWPKPNRPSSTAITSFSKTISSVWLATSLPGAEPLDVPGTPDHPVRVVPDEVGLDQVVGDPLGLVVVAAGGGEDVLGPAA